MRFSLLPVLLLCLIGAAARATVPLPMCLADLLARNGWQPGPNCYHAALFAHYPTLAWRYVAPAEAFYLLGRDFDRVGEGGSFDPPMRGDVLVFDGDDHAAYYLGDGMVFDRRGYEAHYRCRVVPLGEAHAGVSLPPGAPIEARIAFRDANPFTRIDMFRFRADAPRRRPTPATLPAAWARDVAILELLLPWARDQLTRPPSEFRLIVEAVETTIRLHAYRAQARAEATGWPAVAAQLGDAAVEGLLELGSLSASYFNFVRQTHFASVQMTEERYRRNNRSALRASVTDERLRELVGAILRLSSVPSDATAVSARIEQAAAAFDAERSFDLVP